MVFLYFGYSRGDARFDFCRFLSTCGTFSATDFCEFLLELAILIAVYVRESCRESRKVVITCKRNPQYNSNETTMLPHP
jgi:hypothetical protein